MPAISEDGSWTQTPSLPVWGRLMRVTGGGVRVPRGIRRSCPLERPLGGGSHPGTELLFPIGVASRPPTVAGPRVAAGSRGPSWGR